MQIFKKLFETSSKKEREKSSINASGTDDGTLNTCKLFPFKACKSSCAGSSL